MKSPTRLEAALRDELGPGVEVETHIEPLQIEGLAGRDAPAERVAQVQATLTELAANAGAVRDVHDVRVRETPDGEIVNFHCYVDAGADRHRRPRQGSTISSAR